MKFSPASESFFPLRCACSVSNCRVLRQLTWHVRCDPCSEVKMQGTLAEGLYEWVQLVKSEFSEMPGLHLSRRQAQRLWRFDQKTCDAVLASLESANFLKRTSDDSYVRADSGY